MGDWQPLLAAVEVEPGRWQMVAQYDKLYGQIRLVRIAGTPTYVGTDVNGREAQFQTLRSAAEAIHAAFIRSHSPATYEGYSHS